MESGQEFILITKPEVILHLTGAYAEGYLLIGDKNYLFTDPRYFYAVKNSIKDEKTVALLGGLSEVKELLQEKSLVGLDFSYESVNLYKEIKKVTEVFDATDRINRRIARKNETQLEFVQASCSICEKAFLATLPSIRLGMTELELASILEYNFKALGASGTSFDTIIAFGENSAVPHHQTSNATLKKDSVILMDFGCKVSGYCSDMTRTLFFGSPTEEFLQAYSAVQSAHEKAKQNIKSGMSARFADKFARKSLEKKGYGEHFTHSLGHGIGTSIHEYPSLSPKSGDEVILKNGYVFSIEPGVYFDGKFGIRIEDSLYMANGVAVSFMKEDKKLMLVNDGKLRKLI